MIKIEGENCIKIENLLESIAEFLHVSKKNALSAFVNACTAPESAGGVGARADPKSGGVRCTRKLT